MSGVPEALRDATEATPGPARNGAESNAAAAPLATAPHRGILRAQAATKDGVIGGRPERRWPRVGRLVAPLKVHPIRTRRSEKN